MSKLYDFAAEADDLAIRLERAIHTADIAMETLWDEHPTSETDTAKISCLIARFDLYYDALHLALNEVFETRKKLAELSDAMYQANRELKAASGTTV